MSKKRQPVESTKTYRDTLGLLKFLKKATVRGASIPTKDIYKACADNQWSPSVLSTILSESYIFDKDENRMVSRPKGLLEQDIPGTAEILANLHITKQIKRNQAKKEAATSAKENPLPPIPAGCGVVKIGTIPGPDLFSQPDESKAVWDNSIPMAIELLKKNGYKVFKTVTTTEEV